MKYDLLLFLNLRIFAIIDSTTTIHKPEVLTRVAIIKKSCLGMVTNFENVEEIESSVQEKITE